MMTQDQYWDAGMRGCLTRIAQRNYWRIASYEFEDLLQDGMICYRKCYMKYVGRPPARRPDGTLRRMLPADNPDKEARKHFMTIVQHAFVNHIASLSKRRPRKREVPLSDLMRDQETLAHAWERFMPTEEETMSVTVALRTAPREIKQLLALLVDDVLDLGRHRRHGNQRENSNERYCRILGLPADYDLIGQVNQHFLG